MENITEALDKEKMTARLSVLDAELERLMLRLSELMAERATTHAAKKVRGEEMAVIVQRSEAIEAEKNELYNTSEQGELDAFRLDELREFIDQADPLTVFDKDLFRKVVNYCIVHSRYEVEFVFQLGMSRRAPLGKVLLKKLAS